MTTPTGSVNVDVQIESNEALRRVSNVVGDVQKSLNMLDGAFKNYQAQLKQTLKDLNTVGRGGGPGQAIRDFSTVSGGSTIAGRTRQALARGAVADAKQIEEVLVAFMVNAQRDILRNVSKSVQAAMVRDYAKNRQDTAALDAQLRRAQIEAQQARVAFASQLNGQRGARRAGTIESANALGLTNLGTLRQEQDALNALLAAEARITAENKEQLRVEKESLSIQRQINRLTDDRYAALSKAQRIRQIEIAYGKQNIALANAEAAGDKAAILRARTKKEALMLERMIVAGVKEESDQYQRQLGVIRQLANEKARLNRETQDAARTERENTALTRSRRFAAGDPRMQETVINNMVGSRRAAASTEGRASLLGLQGNLLANYALLGTGVAAITGMITSVIDLDTATRELQAIAGATNVEFEQMREVMVETSKATKFSAVELAEGSIQLAQAGQSIAEIRETIPSIANFAMAVGTDMKTAVDIVTTTLTVFNMNAAETERITNVFTEALNRSKLSMDQLQLGFQYAANLVADQGGTFEELTSVLAGMSQAGIRAGSMLGTGLRQILISLADPTKEVAALLKELGLSMNDVDVRTQGVIGVLQNFKDAGLTAEMAMGAFETRTASALIAATNQIDFIRRTEEQLILSRAAEEAAAKQKEALANSTLMLKNALLAIVNEAAQPTVRFFVDLTQTLAGLVNSVPVSTGVIQALGTAIIAFLGVAAVASLGKLGMAFLQFSGVVGAAGGSLRLFMAGISLMPAAFTAAGGGMAGAAGAARMFGAALGALGINPVVLAIMGLVGAFQLLDLAIVSSEEKYADQLKVIDQTQTQVNAAQGRFESYRASIEQVDTTIARLNDRSAAYSEVTNEAKGITEDLRIETLNAAVQFNGFGANIDATGEKLVDLVAKLNNARNAMAELAAQAAATQQAALAALAGQQGVAAQQALAGVNAIGRPRGAGDVLRMGINPQGWATTQNPVIALRAAGFSGKEAADIWSQIQRLGRLDPNNPNTANAAMMLETAINTRRSRGTQPTGEIGKTLDRITKGLSDFGQNQNKANQSRMAAADAGIVADQYRFRASSEFNNIVTAARGGSAPGMTPSALKDAYSRLEAERRKTDMDPAIYQARLKALNDETLRQSIASGRAHDSLLLQSGGAASGRTMALSEQAQLEQQRAVEYRGILKKYGGVNDDTVKKVLSSAEKQAKAGDIAGARETAATVGINLTGKTANEVAASARIQKAYVASGMGAAERGGYSDPNAELEYGAATGAANAAAARADAAGAGSRGRDAERAARDAKKLSDAAASALNRLSNSAEVQAEELLKNIQPGSSVEDATMQINRAREAFAKSEEFNKQYYKTKIEGLIAYRDTIAGTLSSAELEDLNAEIAATQQEADIAVRNAADQFNDKMQAVLDKIPEIGKPLTFILDNMDQALARLDAELQAKLRETNQLTANQSAVDSVFQMLARNGGGTAAEGTFFNQRFQRQIDGRFGADLGATISNLQGRKSALSSALNSTFIIGGQTYSVSDIDRMVESQRKLTGTLDMNSDEYYKQVDLLENMEEVQERVYAARTELLTTEQQLTAQLMAQNALKAQQGMSFGQRAMNAAVGWGEAQGNSIDNYIAAIPGMLDTASGAFSKFFSDVVTGTATVKDAFRTMAQSILQSMMDVVASEVAKSLLKYVISIGASFFSPGATPGVYGPAMREGGFIRAAAGYGVPGRDSVPILAMPGEYVLRKSAVDAIGKRNLDQINADGNRMLTRGDRPQRVANDNAGEMQPVNIYVVSPDRKPGMSRNDIIVEVQENMVNKGPIYKLVRAAAQGAL